MDRTGIYRPTIEDIAELSNVDTLPPGGMALTQRMAEVSCMGPETRVLVVSSARGNQALHYARVFAAEVVGIDIAPEAVHEARQRAQAAGLASRTEFHIADAQDLPFEDATFDIVVNEGAVGIPPRPRKVLSEMVRVARPGGSICFRESTWRGALDLEEKRELTERYGTSVLEQQEWLAMMRDVGIGSLTCDVETWSKPEHFWKVRKDRDVAHYREIYSFGEKLQLGKQLMKRFGRAAVETVRKNEEVFYAAVEAGKLGYGIYFGRKPNAKGDA